MNAVFVYGLLKPGMSLHPVVAPFVVEMKAASARGRLYDAGVPAARFSEDGLVEGFVLWLDEDRLGEALRVLDELEDEGRMYRRITVPVQTQEGTLAAHAYDFLMDIEGRPFAGSSWVND